MCLVTLHHTHQLKNFATKNGIDLGLQTLNTVSGVKMLSYDYDAYKYLKQSGQVKDGKLSVLEEQTRENLNKFLGGVVAKGIGQFSMALDSVGDEYGKSMPLRANQYTGALRPISATKYNSLSPASQRLYIPPDTEHAMALNRNAQELSNQAFDQTQPLKKFVWSFFETLHIGERNKEFEYGSVIEVFDGDTFSVMIGDRYEKVRMLLIDTPESVKSGVIEQPLSKKASDYTKSYLTGKDAKIIFDKSYKDTYNRVLGYIEVDGVDVQELLLEEGLAQTGYLFEEPYRNYEKYTNIEQKAYNDKKGIWQVPNYAQPVDDSGYMQYYDKKEG